MNRIVLTRQILAATLFLATGLRAEETKPTPKPAVGPAKGMKSQREAELLKRFDKNGDGKLDDDERADAKEAMLKEQMDRQAARAAALGGSEQERATMLAMFDKNKDGRLDDDERAAAEKYARENGRATPGGAANLRAELIRRLDQNGDGKIDEVERNAGVQYIAANLDQFPGLKKRFDKNGNGKLDADELVALDEGLKAFAQAGPGPGSAPAPTLEQMPAAMREQVIKRFDKDGNGKLDEIELAAMQAEMARRRAQRIAQAGGGAPAPAKSEAMPPKSEEARIAEQEEEASLKKAMEDFAPAITPTKTPEATPKK